jgi:hypothetical protein
LGWPVGVPGVLLFLFFAAAMSPTLGVICKLFQSDYRKRRRCSPSAFFFRFFVFFGAPQALKWSFMAAGGHSSFRALALELPSCRVASLRSPGSPRPPRGPTGEGILRGWARLGVRTGGLALEPLLLLLLWCCLCSCPGRFSCSSFAFSVDALVAPAQAFDQG